MEDKISIIVDKFEDMSSELRDILKQVVRISSFMKESDNKVSGITSHKGGKPALKPNTQWPEHDGVPMFFLGQINLSELQSQAAQVLLPKHGLLCFFCESQYFDNPRDDEFVHVLAMYIEDIADVEIMSSPEDIQDRVTSAKAITFQHLVSFPGAQSLEVQLIKAKLRLDNEDDDEFTVNYFAHPDQRGEDDVDRFDGILGQPSTFCGSPKSAKIEFDGNVETSEEFKKILDEANQVYTLWEWDEGDGDLAILIKKEDLLSLKFSNVWGVYTGS